MMYNGNRNIISTRYDVIRDNVKIAELMSIGNPTIRMDADAAVKTAISGDFLDNPDVNYLKDRIRPYIIINGEEYPLGEYLLTSVIHKTGKKNEVKLYGYDLGKKLERAATLEWVAYAKNNRYTHVVQAILLHLGIEKIICEDSIERLNADRQDWEPGTSYLDIINQLLKEINYRPVWFDMEGNTRLERYKESGYWSINHTYNDGIESITLPGIEYSTNANGAYNVFMARVENPDLNVTFSAVSRNDDPNSPISTVHQGEIMAPIIQVDNIASQKALQEYVDRVRFDSLKATVTVKFTTAIMPVHGVGDIIELNHESISGIFEEVGWEISLGYDGRMQHTVRQVQML